MNPLLLFLSIFISVQLLSQEVITQDIITLDTQEKNKKTVLFSKQLTNLNTAFLLKAMNKTSKDYTGCKWVSTLSEDEVEYFANALENIEGGDNFESSSFKLKSKKNRINIEFKDARCTSEHKLYYFQESCRRSLSFVLRFDQLDILINKLHGALNDDRLVKQ
jgi:hypothetical protein